VAFVAAATLIVHNYGSLFVLLDELALNKEKVRLARLDQWFRLQTSHHNEGHHEDDNGALN